MPFNGGGTGAATLDPTGFCQDEEDYVYPNRVLRTEQVMGIVSYSMFSGSIVGMLIFGVKYVLSK
jgi:hypothetical protein